MHRQAHVPRRGECAARQRLYKAPSHHPHGHRLVASMMIGRIRAGSLTTDSWSAMRLCASTKASIAWSVTVGP